MLLADEVYQTNIYAAGRSFLSFKKASLPAPRAVTLWQENVQSN